MIKRSLLLTPIALFITAIALFVIAIVIMAKSIIGIDYPNEDPNLPFVFFDLKHNNPAPIGFILLIPAVIASLMLYFGFEDEKPFLKNTSFAMAIISFSTMLLVPLGTGYFLKVESNSYINSEFKNWANERYGLEINNDQAKCLTDDSVCKTQSVEIDNKFVKAHYVTENKIILIDAGKSTKELERSK